MLHEQARLTLAWRHMDDSELRFRAFASNSESLVQTDWLVEMPRPRAASGSARLVGPNLTPDYDTKMLK